MHTHRLKFLVCPEALANLCQSKSLNSLLPESKFNCANPGLVSSKIVQSHVVHTVVYVNVKNDYRCFSKTKRFPLTEIIQPFEMLSQDRRYEVILICMCMNDT